MEPTRVPGRFTAVWSTIGENLGLKITSLIIAMALFGMVRGAGTVQRSLEVSVLARLPGPTAHRFLLTDLPDKVRITVKGSPSLVASLRPDDLGPIQLDLTEHRSTINLDPSLLQLPGGVSIVQMQPPSLQLSWDELVERDVPVRAVLNGAPASGMHLAGDVQIEPAVVHVSGPSLYSSIGALPVVRTDPIDITGLEPGTYNHRVALESAHHHVRYDFSGGVEVSFTIERQIVERRLDHVPITPIGDARVELRPPIATVVLRGSPQVINAVDPAEIVPVVDVAVTPGGVRGATRYPVRIPHLPNDVTLVSIEPSEIIVVPEH